MNPIRVFYGPHADDRYGPFVAVALADYQTPTQRSLIETLGCETLERAKERAEEYAETFGVIATQADIG